MKKAFCFLFEMKFSVLNEIYISYNELSQKEGHTLYTIFPFLAYLQLRPLDCILETTIKSK